MRPPVWLPCLLLALPALAQEPGWSGRMRCAEVPDIPAANVPVTIRVENGLVRYLRDVRDARTGGNAGFAETGSGRIGPNGELTLTGSANTSHSRYTASYTGRLDAQGRGTLTGAQDWELRTGGARRRPCTITITRP